MKKLVVSFVALSVVSGSVWANAHVTAPYDEILASARPTAKHNPYTPDDQEPSALPSSYSPKGSSFTDTWSYSLVKGVCGFAGSTLLTEPYTNALLTGVEAGVSSLAGPWVARAVKVMAFPAAYDLAETSAFVTGYKTPDAMHMAYQIAVGDENATEAFKAAGATGLKMGSAAIASYGLTFKVIDWSSRGAYTTTLFLTGGNPVLANLAYYGTKGVMTHTGAGKKIATAIGYNIPDAANYVAKKTKELTGVDPVQIAKKVAK